MAGCRFFLERIIMAMRVLAYVLTFMLIAFSGSPGAQEPDSFREIKRLQNLLVIINSELKSNLDQIQIFQEALRGNNSVPLEAQQGRTPDLIMQNDVAAQQRLAIQRETALNARLEILLVQSAELDARKQPILERVRELSLAPLHAGGETRD
jgi:hypothetical protein